MVQRYAHLSPGRLAAAVEKIVGDARSGQPQTVRTSAELRVGSEGSWT
jgi:hypothetical protein